MTAEPNIALPLPDPAAPYGGDLRRSQSTVGLPVEMPDRAHSMCHQAGGQAARKGRVRRLDSRRGRLILLRGSMQIVMDFGRSARGGRNWSFAVAALAIAFPAMAQYTGPAILSRGEAPASITVPQIRFRPYISAGVNYDTALANVALNQDGQIANSASIGMRLGWGVSGSHGWKKTQLGMAYSGSVSHYARSGAYDSISQNLMLGLSHQFTRRTRMAFQEIAGVFTRNLTPPGLPQTVPFDPNTIYLPVTDYFDNRTMYFSSTADVVYQKTARLSFDFGGGTFVTRRRSSALESPIVAMARTDAQYRISRRTSLGGGYSFQKYTFAHGRGDSTIHMFGPNLSMRVNQWLELSGMVGAARIETKSIQSTPVDPAIAALLGISSTEQIVHRVRYLRVPTFTVRASRGFRTGVVFAMGGHSVTPGNGLFQTSIAYTASAGYVYTGIRRWSVNTQVMYTDAEAIGTVSGKYRTSSASFSVARRLSAGLHLGASYWARKYGSATYSGYDRLVHAAIVSVSWSPGEVPLRLW